MLAEHLDQRHDLASRRMAVIDVQAQWLAALVAPGSRVLDLGCGPGLHLERLAAGLRIEGQFGDACGSPHDPNADFETFLLAANHDEAYSPPAASCA